METEILNELGIKKAPMQMLDVHKNPLLVSILDGVDTLKTMYTNGDIPAVYLQNAKGLLIMKTDKVRACVGLVATYTAQCVGSSRAGCSDHSPFTIHLADWLWIIHYTRPRTGHSEGTGTTQRMVRQQLQAA
jgi:hypothetical protein